MIAQNKTTRASIPVEPWRPGLKVRLNHLGMRCLGRVSSTLGAAIGDRSQSTFGILMHHRIAPRTPGVPLSPYNVEPHRFREQISGLIERGFQFISLRQALAAHADHQPLPPRSVVLTFDDCFESVYTRAWPILQEFAVPATLFLSTAYLDSGAPFPFDTWAEEFADRVPADHYRPIRGDQCREMQATGLVELGTHTHTHADFRGHEDEFVEEMHTASDILKTNFGVSEPVFSFPFGNPSAGYASPTFLSAARASGATCALTTEATLVDIASDPFGWGRLNVFEWDTAATLAGKLSGWYDWAPKLKHRMACALQQRGPS
jgi:peptidoglycan/xylan/chitin deacetylase (PgdA/CDA1 family)